ncbi:TonB-dependent receptor [Alteromonas gilva]|uniref:TonB-dependent receptor n=1 Tax=Alteromonas gilva TaxID=2987522 RepID=A0ABT5KZY3_9ALTE|nr:TonB-dependent receptor [Alteromonas gilva]MDC8829192.1 TonB-dependent receptor [Alteromonas gilva]
MFKRAYLSSAIVLAMTAQPLYAQDTNESVPDEASIEVIDVRGVKASLNSAQNMKMNASNITDSIVAQDIGKLPDNNVAAALQRVTGIQVARTNGEVDQVLIRGLPDVITTLNGRNVFTTTGRSISLADIPADLVYSVDVKKSISASDIEGGIAGSIDVQLRRPFDFDDGFSAAGGLRYAYSDEAESWNPIGSITLNNNWENSNGRFGAMLSVSHQDRDFQDQVNFITAPFILPDSVVNNPNSAPLNVEGEPAMAPNIIGGYFRYGDRTRDSFNASFQWEPNSNSSYYVDVFGVNYEQTSQLNFWVPLPDWGGWGEGYIESYKEGSNVAQVAVRPDAPGTITSNQAFYNDSDTYQFAVGGEWLFDRVTLKSDLAYTDTKATSQNFVLDLTFFADTVIYNFDKNGAGISDVDIRDANGQPYDMTNLDQYNLNTIFDNRGRQEGDALDWTLDANIALDSWIYSVDVGVRLNERSAFNQEAETGGRGNISGNELLLSDFPGLEDYSPSGYMSDVTDLNNTQWLTPNATYLLNNRGDIREAMGYSRAEPEFLPARYYDNTEKNYAAYAQANFSTEFGDMILDGQAGVRFVRLQTELNGNNIIDGVAEPIKVDTSSNELLPSVNLRLQVTDEVYLRAAYGKTINRPAFAALNPSVTYFLPSETGGDLGYGDGGNPELAAVESQNYDLAAEWYFAEASSLTATVFYRDIDGYVKYRGFIETVDGQDFNITRPVNSGAGSLEGIELAYTQFFENLPGVLDGLGVQLNTTLMDHEAENAEGVMEPLPSVSDESYNAILIYERGGLNMRLAYNWRSEWYGSFDEAGDQPGSSVVHEPISSLDFSVNYDVNENLTVTFDGTNLADDVANDYFGGGSADDARLYPRDTYIRDRTFSLGIRYRM